MSDLSGLIAIAENNTVSIVELQPQSLAVLLYALDHVRNHQEWLDYWGEFMSDSDIELIHEIVDAASDDILRPVVMTPVGATMIWHMPTPPDRWLICEGAGHDKALYPELFALWGYKYGGSGSFFAVPDMSGLIPYGASIAIPLDTEAGEATHLLTVNEMPQHNHADAIRVGNGSPARGVVGSGSATLVNINAITANNGGSVAHNNLPPVLGVNFIVYAGRANV
jgi:microcystin-dependent protein